MVAVCRTDVMRDPRYFECVNKSKRSVRLVRITLLVLSHIIDEDRLIALLMSCVCLHAVPFFLRWPCRARIYRQIRANQLECPMTEANSVATGSGQ